MNNYRIINRWDKSEAFSALLGNQNVQGIAFPSGVNSTGLSVPTGPGGPPCRYDGKLRLAWEVENPSTGGWSFDLKVRARSDAAGPMIEPAGWTDVTASAIGVDGVLEIPAYPNIIVELDLSQDAAVLRPEVTLTFNQQPEHLEVLKLTDGVSGWPIYVVFYDPARGVYKDGFPFYGCALGATVADTIISLRTLIVGFSTSGVLRYRANGGTATTATFSIPRGAEFNGVVIEDSSLGSITGGTFAGGAGTPALLSVWLSY